MAAPALVGFIFDLDGVVVDSNRLHVKSWQAVADRHGYPLAESAHIGKCGLRTTAVIRDLLQWPVTDAEAQRIGWEKEELYRDWIRADGIRAIPGVLEFVRQTRALGIPCAVGSSAPRDNVAVCLQALGLTHAFQAAVSGEDVTRGKPAPDIFLAAAAAITTRPEDCVVFEDAPAGVAAAQAAGMRVVALTTSHPRDDLTGADRIVQDFTELAPQRLCGESG
ncbi:MAG: HAD family phosphatase [Kiritimatiellae bacterium]|nr:HAD family phosphatase [Kiritimatiellia bacterium]MDD4342165.1 HAD family phosphatase [Kiritimatiellia bacterium]